MARHQPILQTCGLAVSGLALVCYAPPARADEGGASIYLLGSGAPNSAVLPPVPGIFFDNTTYVYDGSTGGNIDLVLGGKVVADVDATLVGNFTTALWVPSTNVAGGTLALGVALPFGSPMIDASVAITGPLGNTINVDRHDAPLVVGDPLVTAALGWKRGKLHIAASTFVNVPIGNYREGEISNLAFHRGAGDFSLAASWHDEEGSGWDLSGKVGVTINGRNHFTDYDSGNELHIELGAERKLGKQFSAGLFGYQLFQISGDGGSGAKLGSFRGQVTGVGATVAYSAVLGRAPTTFRLRLAREFWEKNRMSGTAAMFSISLPLQMKLPGH